MFDQVALLQQEACEDHDASRLGAHPGLPVSAKRTCMQQTTICITICDIMRMRQLQERVLMLHAMQAQCPGEHSGGLLRCEL